MGTVVEINPGSEPRKSHSSNLTWLPPEGVSARSCCHHAVGIALAGVALHGIAPQLKLKTALGIGIAFAPHHAVANPLDQDMARFASALQHDFAGNENRMPGGTSFQHRRAGIGEIDRAARARGSTPPLRCAR